MEEKRSDGLAPEEIADLVWVQVFGALRTDQIRWTRAVGEADRARELALDIWRGRRGATGRSLTEEG